MSQHMKECITRPALIIYLPLPCSAVFTLIGRRVFMCRLRGAAAALVATFHDHLSNRAAAERLKTCMPGQSIREEPNAHEDAPDTGLNPRSFLLGVASHSSYVLSAFARRHDVFHTSAKAGTFLRS